LLFNSAVKPLNSAVKWALFFSSLNASLLVSLTNLVRLSCLYKSVHEVRGSKRVLLTVAATAVDHKIYKIAFKSEVQTELVLTVFNGLWLLMSAQV
jgi:hypothetical protein